jgi:hypothetical protein
MKRIGQHLGAVNMLKNLLDRAIEEFGDSSLESAAVCYELGHALFLDSSTINGGIVDVDAMEEALEHMAKACSILYSYSDDVDVDVDVDVKMEGKLPAGTEENRGNKHAKSSSVNYSLWAKDQIPRVLIGIGDLHSYQQKHAEAIEVILNAIPYREAAANSCNHEKKSEANVSSLRIHRLVAEVYILASEELLRCPHGKDLIHEETKNVVVKAEDIGRLAQTYYEKAKEKLQDIGKLLYGQSNITMLKFL